MKIVIDKYIPYMQNVLEPYAEVCYVAGDAITASHLRDADALLIRTRTKVNAALLDGTRVNFVGTATVGIDHIDTDYCAQRGITVANAAGCNAAGVMQYMVAALLTMSEFKKRPLHTMTMGIVGVGNVGKLVAKAGQVLGMKVLLNDPPRALREGAVGFTELDNLLTTADAVTIHVPLTPDTRAMGNDYFFRKMKKDAWFFNTSRGEVADEKALMNHAREQLGAVVQDVWQHEPDINKQLLAMTNIATPHIAGYSIQGKKNATRMIIQAVAQFFSWEELFNFEPDVTISPVPLPLSKQDDIYSVVKKTYCITDDDRRLREQPEHFEQLRTNYVLRNEFSGYDINTYENDQLSILLKALACHILL